MILRCASCGSGAPALKQWWNQDTGYGVCPKCFQDEVRKLGEVRAVETYGKPAIHHSIKPETKERINEL